MLFVVMILLIIILSWLCYVFSKKHYELGFLVVVCADFILCMAFAVTAIIAICENIKADSKRALYIQRYNSLIYKSETESIRDEFGIVNKEYIDEVQMWNEDVVQNQSLMNNTWTSAFYPRKIYQDLKTIDLNTIKMKEESE